MDGDNTVNSFVMLLKIPLEHGRATWQHGRNVRIHADVNVTPHDVRKEEDVYSAGFFADATWSGRRRACGEASSHSRFSVREAGKATC